MDRLLENISKKIGDTPILTLEIKTSPKEVKGEIIINDAMVNYHA